MPGGSRSESQKPDLPASLRTRAQVSLRLSPVQTPCSGKHSKTRVTYDHPWSLENMSRSCLARERIDPAHSRAGLISATYFGREHWSLVPDMSNSTYQDLG